MLLSILLLLIIMFNGLVEFTARSLLLWSAMQKYNQLPNITKRGVDASSQGSFISAHIAICNEPPDLVIATLRALASSQFDRYEVIVVDNNTRDPAIWRPVESEMRALGDRFRFFHFDRLAGAKAGALNVALERTDQRATHVAVIDADYQISPHFFAEALRAVSGKVDYVQFPQAYRGVSASGRGVEQELGDYFACFASGAGRPGSMLPTGTLSLFKADALRAVGGWNASTITEDAELGVRLQAAGYRGEWRAERVGHGLLPLDFRGLAKQRARWAAGNMQVLRLVFSHRGIALGARDLVNLVAQLTAWISFWALPAAALVLVALFPSIALSGPIGAMAGGTIVVSSLLTAIRMAMLVEPQEGRWRVQISAFKAKLALTWVSAFAWLPAVLNIPLRFHRTPKAHAGEPADRFLELCLISVAFAALGFHFLLAHQIIEAAACGLLSAVWGCALSTDRCLRVTAALNEMQA